MKATEIIECLAEQVRRKGDVEVRLAVSYDSSHTISVFVPTSEGNNLIWDDYIFITGFLSLTLDVSEELDE